VEARTRQAHLETCGGQTREIPLRHDWPNYPDDFAGMKPAFIKRADVAWYSTHHHTLDGRNEPYAYSYLFVYSRSQPAPKPSRSPTTPTSA